MNYEPDETEFRLHCTFTQPCFQITLYPSLFGQALLSKYLVLNATCIDMNSWTNMSLAKWFYTWYFTHLEGILEDFVVEGIDRKDVFFYQVSGLCLTVPVLLCFLSILPYSPLLFFSCRIPLHLHSTSPLPSTLLILSHLLPPSLLRHYLLHSFPPRLMTNTTYLEQYC